MMYTKKSNPDSKLDLIEGIKISILGAGKSGIDAAQLSKTIDELNSVIGLLRSFTHKNFDKHKKELIFIQNCL